METKVCSKCKEEKDISNFPKFLQRDGSHGIRGTCKKCMNEKYNVPIKKQNQKNKKVEFTEFEIKALKKFINQYEEGEQGLGIEKEKKEFVLIQLESSVYEKLKEQSKKTNIPKNNIINALLIKEFLK